MHQHAQPGSGVHTGRAAQEWPGQWAEPHHGGSAVARQGGARCCVKPFCPDTLQAAFPSRLCVALWIRPSVCQAAARGEQWLGSPGKGSALSSQVTDCGCNPSPAEPAASGSCQLSALGAEAGTLAPAVPLASAGQLCQAQQTNLLASSCKSRPYPLLILAALCPPSRPLPWPTCPELGPRYRKCLT